MDRILVSSSRILSVGYNDNVLEVEFHNGSVYRYYDVSDEEYVQFMDASSLGHELSILDKKHYYEPVIRA